MTIALRFSLRSLFVVITACGLGGGALWQSYQSQIKAVRAITASGGEVLYDYQWPEPRDHILMTGMTPNAAPAGPKWLVETLGAEWFGNVVYVGFNRGATDDDLNEIARLPQVEAIFIGYSEVTDQGLATLKRKKRLQYVWAYQSRITEDGAKAFMQKNPNCEVLWKEPLIE